MNLHVLLKPELARSSGNFSLQTALAPKVDDSSLASRRCRLSSLHKKLKKSPNVFRDRSFFMGRGGIPKKWVTQGGHAKNLHVQRGGHPKLMSICGKFRGNYRCTADLHDHLHPPPQIFQNIIYTVTHNAQLYSSSIKINKYILLILRNFQQVNNFYLKIL